MCSSDLPGFWDTWGDGKGELDAYRLVTPRYGAPRTGYALHVFVTETFTDAQRVKSDGGHRDEFPVLKLNELRRFQTGIYDYSLMTSTFVPLDGRLGVGQPTKVAFSAQEWCGTVFEELLVDPGSARRRRHSYFDGEGDVDDRIALPSGAILADTLPIVVRGIVGPTPVGDHPVFPTVAAERLGHNGLTAQNGTLTVATSIGSTTVPAGTFPTRAVTLQTADGGRTTWQVEEAASHRIVAWERSDGEHAELVGSTREPYWQEHDPGGEVFLEKLGLRPPTALPE